MNNDKSNHVLHGTIDNKVYFELWSYCPTLLFIVQIIHYAIIVFIIAVGYSTTIITGHD